MIEPYRDLQHVYDVACAGLALQGFKASVSDHGRCKYRGPDGLKCAVGHLIPDEVYAPWMEKHTVIPLRTTAQVYPLFQHVDAHQLKHLQRCHDASSDPLDMKESLRRFALLHHLTPHPTVL